jgi:hypothetical protein
LNLIFQTNTKLKELGFKSLIINCNSDDIHLRKDTGNAIKIKLTTNVERGSIYDDIRDIQERSDSSSRERLKGHISSNTTASGKYANIGKSITVKGKKIFLKIFL